MPSNGNRSFSSRGTEAKSQCPTLRLPANNAFIGLSSGSRSRVMNENEKSSRLLPLRRWIPPRPPSPVAIFSFKVLKNGAGFGHTWEGLLGEPFDFRNTSDERRYYDKEESRSGT